MVALDGAAVHGGTGVHSLHNCNRGQVKPGRRVKLPHGEQREAAPFSSHVKSLTGKMVMKTDLCQKVLEGHTNALNFD